MAKKRKSKKRKKGAPPGVDVNEQRRERLEARRRAKAEEEARRYKAERRRKLVNRSVLVAVLGGAAWLLFLRPDGPTEIQGHQINGFRNFGSNDHTGETVSYESKPPVSGPHAPNAAECGVHAEPIQNELQVHSLEHGAVGIQYNPERVDPADIEAIEAIVQEYDSHVFSAPYPDMEHAIAVTSWSRMMPLDSLDESAIREYVEAFRDKGPERGQSCDNTSDEPFEPAAAPQGNGTPSPAPSASP